MAGGERLIEAAGTIENVSEQKSISQRLYAMFD